MAHIGAAKKSLVDYFLKGPSVPSWSARLEMDIAARRAMVETLFNNIILSKNGGLDTDALQRFFKIRNTRVSPIPIELGKYGQAEIPVSSVNVDVSEFAGVGVAEPMLADLVRADSGNGRTIPIEVIVSWNAAEALGQDRSSNELFTPEPLHADERIVLYFHGGYYITGSPRFRREEAAQISKYSNTRVITVEYRLAPKHPFPSQLHDAYIAFLYLLRVGFKANNIILAGDSAGGNLAMSLCHLLRHIGKTPDVRGLVLLAPWSKIRIIEENPGITKYNDYIVIRPLSYPTNPVHLFYKPKHPVTDGVIEELEDPLLSPCNGDFTNFPPMLIQSGDQDVLHYTNAMLYEKLRDACPRIEFEVYKDMPHVFQAFNYLPQRYQSFESIGRFISSL